MRILYLTDVFFPRVNGVSTSIATFLRELEHRGHEVVVVAPEYRRPARSLEDRVRRVASRAVLGDPEDRWMKGSALRRTLRQVLEEGPVDLVHAQTPFVAHYAARRFARSHDLPLVVTYHTFFEDYLHHYLPLPQGLLKPFVRRISRLQADDADRLIVPSSAVRDALLAYGTDTPVEVLPTGLRSSELAGGDGPRFRRRHGIPADQPMLLHVGRMAHEKNVGFLLRVFARIAAERSDVLLVLAGEGPAVPRLRREIRRLGLGEQVRFLGYLERENELLNCYAAADLFLFASRTETQGLVLLESMALGTPVVSTAVLGTRDVVRTGHGAVVVPEDEERFAREVLSLLADPLRRGRLSREAVAWAQEWSAGRMAERLLGVYRDVVGIEERARAVPA
ncbi:MAG: glycosyltransferase [Acidobacteriota bacterium]|nr:glycosyltransferase [Acidobacteriota bacterium]